MRIQLYSIKAEVEETGKHNATLLVRLWFLETFSCIIFDSI